MPSLREIKNFFKNNDGYSDYKTHDEASEYSGCEFIFSKKKYIFRAAKVTPKKNGLFVTFWKRNNKGLTEPFSINEEFNTLAILCIDGAKKGLFLFTKEDLVTNKILKSSEIQQEGKRGFRIYPSWSEPQSKQAIRSQAWQKKHFSKIIALK